MTSAELKKANDTAAAVLGGLFVFCFCLPAAAGFAFRVFRIFAGL